MPIEGPLRERGIHDVFQLLDLSRKTGVLRVTSELRHNAGTVYFEDGAIIFAEIRSNPHPLGALLLRTGKITEADLERGRDMQHRQGDQRRLGEILVSLGAITPRELQRQVRFQIEEVVFELMSWREGYFSFTEGTLTDLPTEATVRIPTEALLMEGARRIDEWSRIEGRIPHLGVIPTLAPPAGGPDGELDLLPPEWEMLAMIDGERDLRTIASELGRSEFEVAKTLFGLESAGIVVLVDPGTVKRERTTLTSDLAELVAAPRRRWGAGSSRKRARWPSRRRECIRTTRRCICCSAASISRPGAPPPWTSCGAPCGSILCSSPRTASSATRWSPPGASRRRWSSGISGSGWPRARRASWRSSTRCAGRRPRRRRSAAPEQGSMPDEIKTLSSQLAQDPDSLVFLRLGELLRQKG